MSLGDSIQWDKHCFTYCGPERCNCAASASPMQRREHEDISEIKIELLSATDKEKNNIEEEQDE